MELVLVTVACHMSPPTPPPQRPATCCPTVPNWTKLAQGMGFPCCSPHFSYSLVKPILGPLHFLLFNLTNEAIWLLCWVCKATQIQSYIWLKYLRRQNQLSGAAAGQHVSLSLTAPADGFVCPSSGTVTLIQHWGLYYFCTLACLFREERIYRSSRTPMPWDHPCHHSAGANSPKPTGH